MKKYTTIGYYFIIILLFIIACTSCRIQIKVEENKTKDSIIIEENDTSITALSTLYNPNMQNARNLALKNARNTLAEHINKLNNNVTISYTEIITDSITNDTLYTVIKELTTQMYYGTINDIKKINEKMYYNENLYISQITLEILKSDIIDNMCKTISQYGELGSEFNGEQFCKYAEEKINNINN